MTSHQSAGGIARAAKLSSEERTAIARNAAQKRWAKPREAKPAEPSCEECRFWAVVGPSRTGEGYGTCRRYPPAPEFKDDDGFGYWLYTFDYNWCGEFQKR